jgi:ADP-ribose pyrophosphatase YjhB (NUDIX family)
VPRVVSRPIARVAIERDEALLLARHHSRRGQFWCLPGGRVEEGETYAQAAVRELREEAAVQVELDGVILILDDAAGRLELLYRGRIVAGEPRLASTSDTGLVAIAWHHRRSLPADLRPAALAGLVRDTGLAGLPVADTLAWSAG